MFNNFDLILVVLIALSGGISICLSAYAVFCVMQIKGYVEAMKSAPVLRQYVEKFVPVDVSEKAQARVKAAMMEAESEFNKMYDLGSLEDVSAKDNMFNGRFSSNVQPESRPEEDLV